MGPLATGLIGAGAGATIGGLIGRLRDEGISEQDADCFCEAVRRGGVLVSVETDERNDERAAEIIGRGRTVDLDACVAEWRKDGWQGGRAASEPPAASEPLALPFEPTSVKIGKDRKRRTVYSYVRVR
jgi:hypothetical protein